MIRSNSEKPLIVICGPTATGKTAAAVRLSLELGGEVVSADSMQVYRDMVIGTARPDEREQMGVRHHLMGVIDPKTDFSVNDWCTMAKQAIEEIYERGAIPVVTGGTGLYISSLVDAVGFSSAAADQELRAQLAGLASREGPHKVYELLEKEDPEAAQKIHPNDLKRIIRAVELWRGSGLSYAQRIRLSKSECSPYTLCMMGLAVEPRQVLYDRIDARVDDMVARGLWQEVENLLLQGVPPTSTAMQAIGYKEICQAIEGRCTREQAVDLIKRSSRRYAKRQMTWFRRDGRIRWFDACQEGLHGDMIDFAAQTLRLKG